MLLGRSNLLVEELRLLLASLVMLFVAARLEGLHNKGLILPMAHCKEQMITGPF
jgi:hypothetical protein